MKIPRGSWERKDLAPAWLPMSEAPGDQWKPVIRCACGDVASLRQHHVHADGRVTASFAHPQEGWLGDRRPGCGFHEWLELDGYEGPDLPPGFP